MLAQAKSHLLQQPITRSVSQRIIDRLEMIQIDKQQGADQILTGCLGKSPIQLFK